MRHDYLKTLLYGILGKPVRLPTNSEKDIKMARAESCHMAEECIFSLIGWRHFYIFLRIHQAFLLYLYMMHIKCVHYNRTNKLEIIIRFTRVKGNVQRKLWWDQVRGWRFWSHHSFRWTLPLTAPASNRDGRHYLFVIVSLVTIFPFLMSFAKLIWKHG